MVIISKSITGSLLLSDIVVCAMDDVLEMKSLYLHTHLLELRCTQPYAQRFEI